VFARAAAPQHMIFVPRVTDIPAQETSFISWNMSEERHEHNFPSISRISLGSSERYFVEWRKHALIRREQRMLSDHQQWEDIIPPTSSAHDV
jgi:hypothetical protein